MQNKFEDRGNCWYCDCYGSDCIKLTVEKNPDIDGHYVIGIDPIINTSTEKVNCSVFYMNIDNIVKHFKDDK